MASQYDKYRFKDVPLDDATFNARWKDIDSRLGALEAISFDFKADESALVATALTRINTELVPVIEQIQAFTTLADLLTAPSASAITVTASGTVVFQLDDLHRRIFAAPLFVIAGVTGRTDVWMAGQVQSWDADTGRLVISITNARGSGTFATWTLSVCSIPPETPPRRRRQTSPSRRYQASRHRTLRTRSARSPHARMASREMSLRRWRPRLPWHRRH